MQASAGASRLSVSARFPEGSPEVLGVDRFAHPFVDQVYVCDAGRFRPVERRGRRWVVPQCRSAGCSVRYEYALARAAREIDRFGYAALRAGAILAPPSTWLLHPPGYRGRGRYRLRLRSAEGESFASGVWSGATSSNRIDADPSVAEHEAAARHLFQAPYSMFGRLERQTLRVGGALIHIARALGGSPSALTPVELAAFVGQSARIVAQYYGRFPVPELTLLVVPSGAKGTFGMELGNGGASILWFVGRQVEPSELAREWVLVHEMFHLGMPMLPRAARFLAEGLATYQEPLARARAGLITERSVWRQLARGLPLGQPGVGDRGLGRTQTWGRIYWGGALLALLADVELRRQSEGTVSLDSVAREIVARGGHTGERWDVPQLLRATDALGNGAFRALYEAHTAGPVSVDIDGLLASLGVLGRGPALRFDEGAPLAWIRRDLTRPAAAPGVPSRPPVAAADRADPALAVTRGGWARRP